MAALLDTLAAMLEEQGWELRRLAEHNAVGTMVQGRNGSWPCLAVEAASATRLIVYSTYTATVPHQRRSAVCELINRLNYGVALGNFEMDYEDGEVRFRTSIDVGEAPVTRALLTPVVYENLATADRYLPAFQRVIAASASPVEAIVATDAEGALDR
jgi:hypothetical protein